QFNEPVDRELMKQAVDALLMHHDALRLRYQQVDGEWQQEIQEISGHQVEIFSVIDLTQVERAEQAAAIEAQSERLQASLDLSQGPLVRVALFELGDSGSRLLIVIHHLAVDGVSWRILLEDLTLAYQQLKRAETVSLPTKTTSLQYWAKRLNDYAQTDQL